MKPISQTPTEPADYALISLAYGGALAGLAASARRREPLGAAELVPLSAATFALTKLVVREKAEAWLREPFVEEDGGERRPRGRRMRYAMGELLTCTRCMGAWTALGLVGLRLHAPATGRTVTSVLAVSAGNDVVQAAFTWLCGNANRVEERPVSRERHAAGRRRASQRT